MNRLQKIGGWILGGALAVALFTRQKIAYGVEAIYLNGVITPNLIPLKVVGWLANSTIAGVLVRSISGVLVCNGQVVASISQLVNKRIRSNSFVKQDLNVDIYFQESLAALWENIQTGDVTSLSFELVGEVVVGEQWPVGLKFNRVFTWNEIQKML